MSYSTPPRPLLDDLRALPRPFWLLLGGMFINRFGTFVMPFLIIFLWRQGHSLTKASFAVSAFGVGAFCGSILGGWLADRVGRKHTIALGAFAAAAFYMLLYFAQGVPAVMVCAALAGLAGGTFPPACSALLTDVIPEELRVRAWSALRVALNAGFACGAAAAGFLAKVSFFWLFFGDALTSAAFGIVALVALPHGQRARSHEAPWHEALAHIRGNRAFCLTFAGALCAALIFSQFGTSYSAHVVGMDLSWKVFGFQLSGETIYGLLIGWNGLLVMLIELPLTAVTLRFEPRRTIALGYLLLGAGFSMNAVAGTLPLLFIAMTIFTFGEMISAPVASAYVARMAPPQFRGRYMGVLGLSWSLSSIIGPPVGLHLIESGWRSGWLLCGVLGLLGGIFVLRSRASSLITAPEESGVLPAVRMAEP